RALRADDGGAVLRAAPAGPLHGRLRAVAAAAVGGGGGVLAGRAVRAGAAGRCGPSRGARIGVAAAYGRAGDGAGPGRLRGGEPGPAGGRIPGRGPRRAEARLRLFGRPRRGGGPGAEPAA